MKQEGNNKILAKNIKSWIISEKMLLQSLFRFGLISLILI
jgi:hypothetical protein